MSGNKYILSKSVFMRGHQCIKALYLQKKHPDLAAPIDSGTQAIFDTGKEVGLAAHKLFPGGKNAMEEGDIEKAISLTKKWIKEKVETIFEATFQVDGLFCQIDVLTKNGDKWGAFEVKSSTRVKDEYIPDAAFQYFAFMKTGMEINDFSIIYINNTTYVRNGELEYKKLFKIESVLDRIIPLQEDVERELKDFRDALEKDRIPDIEIGPHCREPYECNFKGHCWKHIPEYSVFNISRFSSAWALYQKGIVSIEDIPNGYPLNKRQSLEVVSYLNKSEVIEKDKIQEFLDKLVYPLFYFDFETINPWLPPYDGIKPYENFPFQYSVHIESEPGAELIHREFLEEWGKDPRKRVLDKLLEDTNGKGTILAFFASFEVRMLRFLANTFPGKKSDIENRISRIEDLIEPFRKSHLYNWKMKGSNSLKEVVPAFVPEYSYDDLDISDGGLAMNAYLKNGGDENVRKALREYCKRDTLVMVKIVEKLREICGS